MTRPLPRVDAYLAALPSGVDAYPGCEQKASIFHNTIDDAHSLVPHVDSLPPALRETARRPPPVNTWMREVHGIALSYAVADIYFGRDDDAYLDYIYRRNKDMLGGLLYRALFRIMRPQSMAPMLATRWRQFHRGVDLVLVPSARNAFEARLTYPAHVVDALRVRSYAMAFRAALEVAGAVGVALEITDVGDTLAMMRGAWS